MKIFLTTTLALSTICILEAPQPAQAIPSDSNFHLARGEHMGRGGEMRPIERREEAAREYTGEGRGEDVSSEPHTSEAPRVEDHMHTLQGDHAGEGVSDGGRVHRYEGGDWGATDCDSGTFDSNGICISGNTTTITPGSSNSSDSNSGWTTVQ